MKINIPLNTERVAKEAREARIKEILAMPPSAPTNKNILQAIMDLTEEVQELKKLVQNR